MDNQTHNPDLSDQLVCRNCGGVVFEKLELGQYRYKPDWLERGLPLPKLMIDEWTAGGGLVYRCFSCGKLANEPRMGQG